MTKYIIGLLIIMQTSCIDRVNNPAVFFPIDNIELKFKKGDCISFQIDSINYGAAIIVDYSKDEGVLWYGLCFTDYFGDSLPNLNELIKHRIYGRKVESTFENKGFYIGIDTEYVNDTCFILHKNKFKLIGHIAIDNSKIRLGAQGASGDYNGMIQSFKNGREKRINPPDDYRDHRRKINDFRPDEYFSIKYILID